MTNVIVLEVLLSSDLDKTVSYYFYRVLHTCLGLYREVVTNATIHNSLYKKDNMKQWIDDVEDVCEGDLDSSDDEVNLTHFDVPKEETLTAHVFFTAEAMWSNNRDAIAESMLVNQNPNANAEID
ncbi:Uncharacterized protein Adt_30970 [Abeliophyllum distichum]|uniref:Uncharacterized protein n=1 Tax=Abeliophyllum distichum TaxID=126358 RepID=A0ABD1RCQ9_9LAMI